MKTSKPKQGTRSPLKRQPLPRAGDSLQSELLDGTLDAAFPVVVAVALVGFAIKDWLHWILDTPPNPVWSTAFAVIALVWVAIRWRRSLALFHRLRLGLTGERHVAQLLEPLRRDGYEVFHDLVGGGYNIDHVLIGPAGVFVIETKTHSKTVGTNPRVTYDGSRILIDGHVPDRDPIVQVRAAAGTVRDIIERSTEIRPFIRPVVLYPGWFVNSPRDSDVWVSNDKLFIMILQSEPRRLPREQVRLLAEAIGTYVRASLISSGQ